jgi:glyoxylase-like metal-dependent hydrolase (beta-lactamase superfamily II)
MMNTTLRPEAPHASFNLGHASTGHAIASSRNHASPVEVAPGVSYLTTVFVNLYLVRSQGGACVLVDAGLPATASFTQSSIERHLDQGERISAIVLTHGHFDHAGSAAALADAWDVPIYAHRLELPYLTGASDYAPADPTMGGAIAQLSRLFSTAGSNLSPRVRALPDDGTVPGLPEWRWLHTPGHTAGHVSLFRDDGVLLAGDALTTMDLDSWAGTALERREVDRPPAPLTPDWEAARRSVELLADLEPSTVAAGHGIPLTGDEATDGVRRLAADFPVPADGRYVRRPARADELGLVDLPPPVPDPLPGQLALGAAGVLAVVVLLRLARRRN